MRFPQYGHYSLDLSGSLMEVFATGAWNGKTAEAMTVEMHELVRTFNGQPWGALIDGRRWILATPECQKVLADAIKYNVQHGLRRAAYVLDPGMIKRAQLQRTHPGSAADIDTSAYQREYFTTYFAALNWLASEGFRP